MTLQIENKPPASAIHVIWAPIVIIFVAAAGILKPYLRHLPVCIFHAITGVPCPTCGGTRCLAALSSLDFGSSFMYNPMIMLGTITLFIFSFSIFWGLISQKRLRLNFSSMEKNIIRYIFMASFIANWAFLILEAR